MTDNRTNEPTPEQILWELYPDDVMDHNRRANCHLFLEQLRAHGLLSEGAPSEAQARAIRKLDNVQAILAGAQASVTDAVRELSLTSAALTAAQGAAPQAEQATYLNVAHSSVLAGSINARRPAREVSAMQLIDAIYDPDEDDANDSVRYGYVLEQFERLRVIYADLDDPDAGPAQVLPSSGIDEDALAEVERAAAARALEEAADDIESRRNEPGLVHLDVRYAGYYTGIRSGMESDSKALRVRAAEIREGKNDE